MTMTLYPYQREGAEFLASRPRGYLADEQGLGKTVQALHAARLIGAERVLVFAPASAVPNWSAEAKLWHPGGQVVPVSYAKAIRDDNIRGEDWDLVICDEAHYLKNLESKRGKKALVAANRAPRAFMLSGTPMVNHPGELWAPFRALWAADMRRTIGGTSYRRWFDTFCLSYDNGYERVVYGIKNAPLLRELVGRHMTRRTTDEVDLDLPPIRVDTHLLPADESFVRLLENAPIPPDLLEAMVLAGENDPAMRRLLGIYKAPKIADIISKELDDNAYHKVVVFAYHRDVLTTLRNRFERFGVCGFDGSTPTAQRQGEIDRFREGTERVFVAQQQAAGIAINLQSATEVVLVEPAWTPAENAQAIKRIHRIGQTRPCRARVFGVEGTVDESIMRSLARKIRMLGEAGLLPKGATK